MDNRFDLVPDRQSRFTWLARSTAVILAVPLATLLIVLPFLITYLALLIYVLKSSKWLQQ